MRYFPVLPNFLFEGLCDSVVVLDNRVVPAHQWRIAQMRKNIFMFW